MHVKHHHVHLRLFKVDSHHLTLADSFYNLVSDGGMCGCLASPTPRIWRSMPYRPRVWGMLLLAPARQLVVQETITTDEPESSFVQSSKSYLMLSVQPNISKPVRRFLGHLSKHLQLSSQQVASLHSPTVLSMSPS